MSIDREMKQLAQMAADREHDNLRAEGYRSERHKWMAEAWEYYDSMQGQADRYRRAQGE